MIFRGVSCVIIAMIASVIGLSCKNESNNSSDASLQAAAEHGKKQTAEPHGMHPDKFRAYLIKHGVPETEADRLMVDVPKKLDRMMYAGSPTDATEGLALRAEDKSMNERIDWKRATVLVCTKLQAQVIVGHGSTQCFVAKGRGWSRLVTISVDLAENLPLPKGGGAGVAVGVGVIAYYDSHGDGVIRGAQRYRNGGSVSGVYGLGATVGVFTSEKFGLMKMSFLEVGVLVDFSGKRVEIWED